MNLAEFQAAANGANYVSAEAADAPMCVMLLTCQDGRKVLALILDVFPPGHLEALAGNDPPSQAPPEVAAMTAGPEAVLNQWE